MRTVSILVVDDERPIRTLISRILEGEGHDVRAAGNGQDALALCNAINVPIDLLITDVVMPGMDGLRLAEHVERIFPGIRVLFISGKCDLAAVEKHIANTPHRFLAKPFSVRALARQVREMLEETAVGAGA